jgi:hypothetical protein
LFQRRVEHGGNYLMEVIDDLLATDSATASSDERAVGRVAVRWPALRGQILSRRTENRDCLWRLRRR